MRFLIDTCGWLEWLTDGVLAIVVLDKLRYLHLLI